jgi:hypothetical protein
MSEALHHLLSFPTIRKICKLLIIPLKQRCSIAIVPGAIAAITAATHKEKILHLP